jgi:hypothetical protein
MDIDKLYRMGDAFGWKSIFTVCLSPKTETICVALDPSLYEFSSGPAVREVSQSVANCS